MRRWSGRIDDPPAEVGDDVSSAEVVHCGGTAAECVVDLIAVMKFLGGGQGRRDHSVGAQVAVRCEGFEKLLGRDDCVAAAGVPANSTSIDESPERLVGRRGRNRRGIRDVADAASIALTF